jgi:hypothetical protein
LAETRAKVSSQSSKPNSGNYTKKSKISQGEGNSKKRKQKKIIEMKTENKEDH